MLAFEVGLTVEVAGGVLGITVSRGEGDGVGVASAKITLNS
jgi:hypothetical protein